MVIRPTSLRLKYEMPDKTRDFVRLHPPPSLEDVEIQSHSRPENHNAAFILWVERKIEKPTVYFFKGMRALTKRTTFSNLGKRPLVLRPLAALPEGVKLIERILRRDGSIREALEHRKWSGYVSKEAGMSAEKEMTCLDSKHLQEREAIRSLEWYYQKMVERAGEEPINLGELIRKAGEWLFSDVGYYLEQTHSFQLNSANMGRLGPLMISPGGADVGAPLSLLWRFRTPFAQPRFIYGL
ncbi:hypothetical protein WG66_006721 [Moniliophthora roreri]|nr:hypothetical protein WG66_006721 [Moniliophthora roreri]